MTRGLAATADSFSALADDLRRRIYLFTRHEGRPVTREEVAAHVGISRKLAAFHLDKLIEKGLLKADYARPAGRTGPGAGRTSKFYEPSELRIEVSIPPRRYDFLARILLEVLDEEPLADSARDTARRVAREAGVRLGMEVRRERRLRPAGPERALAVAEEVLDQQGFVPYRDELGALRLRNCPFQPLAAQAPESICVINQAFIDGLLRGLGNESVDAVLERRPGECCVDLRAPRTVRSGRTAGR